MKALSPVELGRLLWRRRIWVIVPMLAGLAGGLAALRLMTPIYRASTLIMVESQQVPQNYVKATVTTSLQERLQTIEQQITNRANLERIIEEVGLHPELVAGGQMAAAVSRVRQDLTLQVQGSRIFRIFFKAPDPVRAAQTANLVGQYFIAENLRIRESQAQNTSAFLEGELAETKARLEEQEAKVAHFRIMNDGRLPDQRDANLAALAHLDQKLEINLDAIENAEIRKLLLQREAQTYGGSGVSTSDEAARLRELRIELSRLRSQYTDRHPDVVRLRHEIAALESGLPATDGGGAGAQEPLAVQQLRQIDLEIARLQQDRSRILSDIERYQRRLEEIPRVEQELLSLTRDYDNTRKSYQALLAKRTDARLAENLEMRRQSEQFRILEEATPPGSPFAPNPLLLLTMGLAAGAALGVGLVFLREEFDQSFVDANALEDAFPAVPVIAVIPVISDGAPEQSRLAHGRSA